MKKPLLFLGFVFAITASKAQVGIGTTTPTTTLDVRGSLALNSRTFLNSSSVTISDYVLVFNGTSASTLTLPDATSFPGRIIHIKNARSGTVPVLTIATTSSQTIDGNTTWLLDDPNESINVVSDGANWKIMGQTLPSGSGLAWSLGGNSVASAQKLGTISNYDLPIITNNTERMRIANTGHVIVGNSSSALNGTNPERLLVDAGTTTSYNVISGKGSIDNYLQLNIQNNSTGTSASSDIVATANNGTEAINYVNLGINGGSNTSSGIYGGANTAYLYSTGTDFAIGNATSNRHLLFFTNGTTSANERMRIMSSGNVGIANTNPAEKLDVTGNVRFSGALMPNGSAGTLGYVLTSSGAGAAPTWQDGTSFVTNNAWTLNGNNVTAMRSLGTTSNFDLPFITAGVERMRLDVSGDLGIGTTAPTEKLQVDGNIRLSSFNKAIFFDADTDPYAGIKNVSRTGEVNELMLFSGNDVSGGYGADRIRLATHEIHFATASTNPTTNTGDATAQFENTTTYPTQMIINQNGNVGIGTTTFSTSNPEQLVVDAGATGNSDYQNVIVGKGNTNSYAQLNIKNSNTGTQVSSDVVATASNGNESANYIDMGINGGGNTTTGILGGSNTAYLFSTGNNFVIGNSSNNKDLLFYTTFSNVSTERLRITSGGTVQPGSDNSASLGASGLRWSAVYAANGTIQTSDARLKTNIQALNYGLKEVLAMRPVRYNWKEKPTTDNKIGLVAQEVKALIPEVVSGDEAKENLGMNYAELVPVLVNAIKEQQQQIDELKKQVAELKNK